MEYKKLEIKKGIQLHQICTNKFKTNIIAIFLTSKLNRDEVTKNALIPKVLNRGTNTFKTQEEISKKLEEMYGASFDCGVDKIGDNQVLKFYIETINDDFLPKKENLLTKALECILDIVFNPLIEKRGFNKEYVEQEKENLVQIISAKRDNKARYSLESCIENMYKGKPYGLYKYGYIEDVKDIDEENLYKQYVELINTCKIDIFISGNIKQDLTEEICMNKDVEKLPQRENGYNMTVLEKNNNNTKEKIIEEKMEVNQGKLIIGLDIDIDNEDLKYDVMIYNCILGGSANSKLFQNVREKGHLAYVASSSYLRHKNNIFIICGIEIENYNKALDLIKEQITEIKEGIFTDIDIKNAKRGVVSIIESIEDEEDSLITYYFGQELSKDKKTLEEYKERINKVTKEDVQNIADKVRINTIYFLRN